MLAKPGKLGATQLQDSRSAGIHIPSSHTDHSVNCFRPPVKRRRTEFRKSEQLDRGALRTSTKEIELDSEYQQLEGVYLKLHEHRKAQLYSSAQVARPQQVSAAHDHAALQGTRYSVKEQQQDAGHHSLQPLASIHIQIDHILAGHAVPGPRVWQQGQRRQRQCSLWRQRKQA